MQTKTSSEIPIHSHLNEYTFFKGQYQMLLKTWRKQKPSYTAGRNVKCTVALGKEYGSFLKS